MNTRVGMQSIYQNEVIAAQQITSQLQALQAQASTGQKFANVSDDPAAALSLLNTSDQEDRLNAHLGDIQSATTALNTGVSALQEVNNIFTQAKSIALQASNSTNDTTSFTALASQVNGLISQLLSVANTQNNGSYIFAGTATQTPPYTVTAQDAQGNPTAVSYQGASTGASAIVDDNRQVEIYYPGSDIFRLQSRQAPAFTGNTGIAPGAGTDSASGQATLTLTHTATTFAPGSGVQSGTSGPSGDTILGVSGAHNLQITDTSGTGASGTVSLDGGPAIAFTSADTNLRVTSNNGDVVYLDTSAITPGFSGTVALTGSGTMSIDGGATTTPLTFAATQSVTDSATGGVTFVDTSNVQRTGATLVDYPGTSDAFQALITLRNDLNNVNNLSEDDQIKALSGDVSVLDDVNTKVLTSVGEQSASLQSLSALQTHVQALQLSAKQTMTDVGGADVTDVVVKLQAYQQLLQMSLASFSQIQSTTLLNYLK